MFDYTIPIWIISITLLVFATLFTWVGRFFPSSKRQLRELEKDEYLRNTEYIRDVSKVKNLREMQTNQKLRHEHRGVKGFDR